jgi:hypothetical protein
LAYDIIETIAGHNLGFKAVKHADHQAIGAQVINDVWIITLSDKVALVISRDNIYVLKESEG